MCHLRSRQNGEKSPAGHSVVSQKAEMIRIFNHHPGLFVARSFRGAGAGRWQQARVRIAMGTTTFCRRFGLLAAEAARNCSRPVPNAN
jgi:hypothetical protein